VPGLQTDVGDARLQNLPHNTQHRLPLLVFANVLNKEVEDQRRKNILVFITGFKIKRCVK
jgi:hypothetical protein